MPSLSQSIFEVFTGTLDELIDAPRHGWLFRGQPSRVSQSSVEPTAHLQPSRFIHCLSNHDQTGNRAFGERLHHVISAEAYPALSMPLCFSPYPPMFFMGQEWGATSPFLYFWDHNEQLGPLITEGRRREFSGF